MMPQQPVPGPQGTHIGNEQMMAQLMSVPEPTLRAGLQNMATKLRELERRMEIAKASNNVGLFQAAQQDHRKQQLTVARFTAALQMVHVHRAQSTNQQHPMAAPGSSLPMPPQQPVQKSPRPTAPGHPGDGPGQPSNFVDLTHETPPLRHASPPHPPSFQLGNPPAGVNANFTSPMPGGGTPSMANRPALNNNGSPFQPSSASPLPPAHQPRQTSSSNPNQYNNHPGIPEIMVQQQNQEQQGKRAIWSGPLVWNGVDPSTQGRKEMRATVVAIQQNGVEK